MSITSSVVTLGNALVDGRKYVREVHSDASGVAATIDYLSGFVDYQAVANARALVLNVQLADDECVLKIGIDATPLPLRFQTAAQFLDRLRAIYKNGSRVELAKLARWVTRRIDDGTVTAAQLRTAFGLTSGQWTTLENKMRALRANQDAIDAAVGE